MNNGPDFEKTVTLAPVIFPNNKEKFKEMFVQYFIELGRYETVDEYLLQRENPELECVQVITSETSGKQGDVNISSFKHGAYVWCRVGYKNGIFGPWVCCGKFHDRTNDKGDTVSAKLDCAQEGPIYCLRCLQYVPVVQDIAFHKTKLQKVCRVANLLRNFVRGPKDNAR